MAAKSTGESSAAAEPARVTEDTKLAAFNLVAAAVSPLASKADRYAVLSAAAQYFGFTLKLTE